MSTRWNAYRARPLRWDRRCGLPAFAVCGTSYAAPLSVPKSRARSGLTEVDSHPTPPHGDPVGVLHAENRRAHSGAEVLMSGTLVLRHLVAFRAELGDETVDRAIATLADPLQAEVAALVAGAWLAVEKLDRVYSAMADASGRPLEELLPLITERGNEEAFSTIWRALMRMAPGRLVLQRATVVFEKTYTHGVMRARSSEGGAVLELTQWPGITRNRLIGIAAATRAALRLAGKNSVDVEFETTPDGAVFHVRY